MGRAQAYTLEGFVAALIVAGSVLVGLQAVDTSPWDVSQRDLPSEARQQEAQDLLAVAYDRGALDVAVRCVDDAGRLYPGVANRPIAGVNNTTTFGPLLNGSLAKRGLDYRVEFSYLDSSGTDARTVARGNQSNPDGQVVTATRTLALTDSMQSYERRGVTGRCVPRGETLAADSDHYIPDARPSSPVYNVVQVRLEIWGVGST